MTDRITLAVGDVTLMLAPGVGGSIAAFRWRGHDILRPASPEAVAARDPLGLSAFPLVPYSNRIADGRFDWNGRMVRLKPNYAGSPHSIHGLGWLAPWSASAVTTTTARLTFVHPAGDWPWDFVATQDFIVQPNGLDWVIAVTNHGDTPMPAGLGLHPYFPNPAGTRLRAQTKGWWATDALVMPTDYIEDPRTELTDRLHPLDADTDNVFAGFGGDARIEWPDGIAVDIVAGPAARWLVVYAPVGDTIAAVEAVTHPTDALNIAGHPGIAALAPGATLALGTSFRIRG